MILEKKLIFIYSLYIFHFRKYIMCLVTKNIITIVNYCDKKKYCYNNNNNYYLIFSLCSYMCPKN